MLKIFFVHLNLDFQIIASPVHQSSLQNKVGHTIKKLNDINTCTNICMQSIEKLQSLIQYLASFYMSSQGMHTNAHIEQLSRV